jgi:hypothetical protein
MKVKIIQGKIFPTSPFDFSKSINFMNMFTPTNGEQTFNESILYQGFVFRRSNLGF